MALSHSNPHLQARLANHSVGVELANLFQAGDPSLRLLHQHLSQELEHLKDKLLSADPSVVQKLQGEAAALKRTLDTLTTARKIGI